MRALLRRFRQLREDDAGFTLVEVVATVVILGIIMVPLGAAMIVGFRTMFDLQERQASVSDVQQLSTYFPQDVQSVDADGVTPQTLDDEGICKSESTTDQNDLITFRWDSDLGNGNQTVVRYIGRFSGRKSQLVRRICAPRYVKTADELGLTPAQVAALPPCNPLVGCVEIVVAKNFGMDDGRPAYEYLKTEDGEQTPVCFPRSCLLEINGAYHYELDAQRRVEGDGENRLPPGQPTAVHAIGGNLRATVYWTNPPPSALPIDYYLIEETTLGVIGGSANPTHFPASGAQINGLVNSVSYTFRVQAHNLAGYGPWSEWSAPVTPGPTTADPPTLDTASGDDTTAGKINATWSIPTIYNDGGSAITGFRLYALSPSASPKMTEYLNAATRAGSVLTLGPNTHYQVQVTALNSFGESSPSVETRDALTLPAKPSTPTLAGSGGSVGVVNVNFTLPTDGNVSDLEQVRAKVGTGAAQAPVDVASACPGAVPSACQLTVTGVPVTGGTVTVAVSNATGWSPDSDPLTIGADTTNPTVAITFPNSSYETSGSLANGCASGSGICGVAADAAPGGVANVTVSVKRTDVTPDRYWNGNTGTSTNSGQPWNSQAEIKLPATGTNSWFRALTSGSLVNNGTYLVTATATDTTARTGQATTTFTYTTGGSTTGSVTAPTNNQNISGTFTVKGNASTTSPLTVASATFQYSPAGQDVWTTIGAPDTSFPYSVDWNTTTVTDGAYNVRVLVADSSGNTFASDGTAIVTRVDNLAPTGSITAPAANSFVRGNAVAVTSDSADTGSGVLNAQFQYKPSAGTTWTNIGAAVTTAPYTTSWNTTTLTDGNYELRVITTDRVGHTFTSPSILVRSDNTPPVIGVPTVVGTLGSNGWYTSNVSVTWPAPTDPGSGIATTSGCDPSNITTNTTTTGQILTCSAFDNAGNFNSRSVTIKRDATPPTGSVTTPPDGGTIGVSSTVRSDSDDEVSGVASARFEYSVAGANTWTTIGTATTTPYQVTWNTSALPLGSYDVRVVTTDNAGLTFTSPVNTVTVDSTPPTVAITFPVNGGIYNTAGYNATCPTGICGTAADTAPGTVASVAMTIQRSSDNRYWNGTPGTGTGVWLTGSTNLPATGTTSWTRAFTTASLSDGVTYTIVARATDAVGNVSSPATSMFKYDTTNPTGSITAPSAGANVRGSAVNVTSNSADGSGVASATFQYKPNSGSTWTTIGVPDTSSPYGVTWNTTLLTDGQYDLRVTTLDNAGNSFTSPTVTVRVDNTNPTGTITVPTDGDAVRGSAVAVTSNSADSGGSGVASALFERSPAGANTWTNVAAAKTSSPYTVSWNTTTGTPDGLYDLRVTTTDNAGNTFTSGTIAVRVDNTGPSIGAAIVTGTLGSNGWYTSNVTVSWPAPTDAGGIATTTCNTPVVISTNTTGQAVTCTATDNAGNQTTSTPVTIKRDNQAPTGSITAPNNGDALTGTFNVTSSSADAVSGVANAKFEYSISGNNSWTQIGALDTATPYQQSWNTTGLADGNYDIRVTTTDNAGNAFTSPNITINIDRTPPTVVITFPANPQYGTNAWNNGCTTTTGQVCGTASDGFGSVASVVLTVRRSSDNRYWNGNAGTSSSFGQPWNSTTPVNLTATGTATWTRAFTTASLQTGVTYTITAVATDSVGLSSTTATKAFTYLTTAPTATLSAPANGADVQGTVAVSGTAGVTSPATVASASFEYKPNAGSTWTEIDSDTSSPYSVSWDTTTLADGDYNLRMITTDSAGNTGTSTTRTVTVDNNPPTGSVTAPSNGSYVRATVNVTSNSADAGTGVLNAQFQYKADASSTWTDIGAADASSPYSASWNTTALAEGTYNLRVITTDNAGSSFTSPAISVIVDNTGPTIGAPSITGTLGANGWYTSNVTVTWPTPTDPSGIDVVNGCGTTNITTNTAGQTLPCSATDNAGNTTTATPVTIKRDASAPTGSLTAPADGASISASVTVSANSADADSGVANASFQYSTAGAGSWNQIGAADTVTPYSVSWNPSSLPDGDYDLRVVTTNNAGLTFTSPIRTVSVDTTPPVVTITFPVNGAAYNLAGWAAGCVTNDVCGTASDGIGTVANVTLTIRRDSDNRYWTGTAGTTGGNFSGQWRNTATDIPVTGTAAWSRSFTTGAGGSIQSGVVYTIVATATDGVGLDGSATSVFTYDTLNPTGTITAPVDNANVSGVVAVTSNSADADAGVASAAFQRAPSGTSTWTTIDTDVAGAPWSASWDTTGVANGLYDLRVVTTDRAGNVFTSSSTAVTVRVDNIAPTGELTAPADDAFVKGSVSVSSNSADTGGSGLLNATFQRSPAGAGSWTTIGSDAVTPYSVSWNTTTVSDGSYDLRVISADNAGNQFISATRTVKVDNNGPTIVGTATGTIGDNGWYTTNVGLTWSVTDAFGVASSSGCGNQNVTSDTTGVDFTCTATDPAGNSNNGTVSIQRDTVNPTGTLTAPADGTIVGSTTVTMNATAADATSGVASVVFQRRASGGGSWTTVATDTSSPYSTSFSTASLASGDYDLQIITTDKAGHSVTSPISTLTVDRTKPSPTNLTLNNGAGGTVGRIDNGDFVTITYSEPLAVDTLCTTWSGDGTNQTRTGNVSLAASSDVLSITTSQCGNIGSIDTNGNYNTSNNTARTFNGSTFFWNAATNQLTITLAGASGGSQGSNVPAAKPTYTPTTNITDEVGNTMSASPIFTAPNTSRF